MSPSWISGMFSVARRPDEPIIGIQTIWFPRFGTGFYERMVRGLLDFLALSPKDTDITLTIFLHGIDLPHRMRREIAAAAVIPVRFVPIRHHVLHPRECPDLYCLDINAIYRETLKHNQARFIFHIDGDVMPMPARFLPADRHKQILREWIDIILSDGSPYAAVCNIGSRYYEPGAPLFGYYRPYHYRGDYELLFSTQSFFCERALLEFVDPLEVSLERAVSERLRARGLQTLNLYGREGFLWRHHYQGRNG